MPQLTTREHDDLGALGALGLQLGGALDAHVRRRRQRITQAITAFGAVLCIVIGLGVRSGWGQGSASGDFAAATADGTHNPTTDAAPAPTTMPAAASAPSTTRQRSLTGDEFAVTVVGAIERFVGAGVSCDQTAVERYRCVIDNSTPRPGDDTIVSLSIQASNEQRTLARCSAAKDQPDTWDCDHYVVDVDQALADVVLNGE